MPDLSRPLEECLQAVKGRHNLQEILRRYPAERDELVALLRLSVDLNSLGAPAADPAFRLRARNQMLAVAAQRRQAERRAPFAWLPRPAARLAVAGAAALALVAGGLTAAAAAANTLPGDPLYGVKLGVERVELAITFNSAARARLQLQFADARLNEAQRLTALGRTREALALVNQYGAAVVRFNDSLASTPFDDAAVSELNRYVHDRQQLDDASLNALVGSFKARGDTQTAAIVAQAQANADQQFKGSQSNLQAHKGSGGQSTGKAKPAGADH